MKLRAEHFFFSIQGISAFFSSTSYYIAGANSRIRNNVSQNRNHGPMLMAFKSNSLSSLGKEEKSSGNTSPSNEIKDIIRPAVNAMSGKEPYLVGGLFTVAAFRHALMKRKEDVVKEKIEEKAEDHPESDKWSFSPKAVSVYYCAWHSLALSISWTWCVVSAKNSVFFLILFEL